MFTVCKYNNYDYSCEVKIFSSEEKAKEYMFNDWNKVRGAAKKDDKTVIEKATWFIKTKAQIIWLRGTEVRQIHWSIGENEIEG